MHARAVQCVALLPMCCPAPNVLATTAAASPPLHGPLPPCGSAHLAALPLAQCPALGTPFTRVGTGPAHLGALPLSSGHSLHKVGTGLCTPQRTLTILQMASS